MGNNFIYIYSRNFILPRIKLRPKKRETKKEKKKGRKKRPRAVGGTQPHLPELRDLPADWAPGKMRFPSYWEERGSGTSPSSLMTLLLGVRIAKAFGK